MVKKQAAAMVKNLSNNPKIYTMLRESGLKEDRIPAREASAGCAAGREAGEYAGYGIKYSLHLLHRPYTSLHLQHLIVLVQLVGSQRAKGTASAGDAGDAEYAEVLTYEKGARAHT